MPAGSPPPAGLAGQRADDAPHLILFPERPFDEADVLRARSKATVERVGFCVVVASEGIRTADGSFVADAGGGKDAFGHTQLGGVASLLAARVKDTLGYKVHWTLPDYLQRSARHLASKTDLDQAQAVGKAAVEFALKGMNAVMPVIERTSETPYRWKIEPAPLRRRRQPREEDARQLHPQGWLRHHRCGAPLPRTADPRRGTAAVRPRRVAEVRGAARTGGDEEAAGVRRLSPGRPTFGN